MMLTFPQIGRSRGLSTGPGKENNVNQPKEGQKRKAAIKHSFAERHKLVWLHLVNLGHRGEQQSQKSERAPLPCA